MSNREVHSDVLIIGGGPAGITFCRKLKKLKPEMSIIMLRPEEHSMVYCAIPYALEGLIDHRKTFKRDELVTDTGTTLVRRAVKQVDLQAKRVVDETGDIYTANILFLATGARNFVPPVQGADAENVYTVKTQGDMERLFVAIDDGAKRAALIGAGAIGIEQAQAYRTRGLDVYLVDIAPSPGKVSCPLKAPLYRHPRMRWITLCRKTRNIAIRKCWSACKQNMLAITNH